eukprot:CAMPEP_0201517744 /NCGR_PEP_ID=MMETSP0161_2-20130828/8790_1 /ASSEMBLY_ACC=CAM_ASM_000251 /TAXON_ID=180227 /ORGANISM="Neoparamoeba aestuarina, Strain SoJaBio B1-5/56/2" /LENGTH=154 /DNA_ID=CAMNT_0047915351 /DNA_START=94 /DNA_END=558 /DNA_ORIENTATION=+
MRKRIMRVPKIGGPKPSRTALGVYVKKHYKSAAGANCKKPLKVISELRKKFATLTAAQRKPFEAVAKTNKKAFSKRRNTYKGTRINGYSLFMKQNYHKAPAAVASKGFAAVGKYAAKQWKALSAAGKAKYVKQAAAIRATSNRNWKAMVRAYKA